MTHSYTTWRDVTLVYRFIRANLEPKGGYRFIDSATRIGITHTKTFTKLRVLSSNGKTAMGIVGCPLLVADEPGSWEVTGGTLMHDAITTAQGKPGSPMKVVYIGTLAPASSGWWHDLVQRGTHGSVYVQSLQGQPEKWDQWQEIRRCNPLTAIDPDLRRKLLEERDEGRRDSRLKARFLSFRLNVPDGGRKRAASHLGRSQTDVPGSPGAERQAHRLDRPWRWSRMVGGGRHLRGRAGRSVGLGPWDSWAG